MSCSVCKFPDLSDCEGFQPKKVCVNIVRGTDDVLPFILLDALDEPVDITADEVKLTVKDKIDGTTKIQKTNGPIEHVDPTNGKTAFALEPGDITEDQGSDRLYWVYEVRRIEAGTGNPETVHFEGDFVVDPQVGV